MGVKYHQLDIRKKKNFLKLSRNFDYVVNAGGYGGYSTNDNIYKNNNSQYQAIKNLSNFFLKTKLIFSVKYVC